MIPTSANISESPEIRAMRFKIMQRVAMLFILALFVILAVLNRVNLLRVDGSGAFGTVHIILAFIAIVFLALDRDSYLPFLGECVLPTSLLAAKTPQDATFTVDVRAQEGATHIMYWASESGAGLVPNPYDAYGNYSNAGIVKASSAGLTTLPVRCPRQYQVRGRTLPRHVHYRSIYKSGIAGPVQTVQITCV